MILEWLKHRKWRKSKALTSAELFVVQKLLPKNDPRSAQLLSQATNAPYVERKVSADTRSYEVSIPFVLNPIDLIDLDSDLVSPPLDLRLVPSNNIARFQLVLLKGGFLHGLRGTLIQGAQWVRIWEVSDQSEPTNFYCPEWLPTDMSDEERVRILSLLEDWAGVAQGRFQKYRREELRIFSGCSEEDKEKVEQQESLALPKSYAEMIAISDGIDVIRGRPFVIGGTRDLRNVKGPDSENGWWLITDLLGSGWVVLHARTSKMLLWQGSTVEDIRSLEDYVKDSISMLEKGRP